MTDHTTLAAWLPILQHPEVGERICEAAGCRLQKDSEGVSVTELWFAGYGGLAKSSHLFEWQLSALGFGTLAVLEQDRDGDETTGICEAFRYAQDRDFRPPAVLAAALRVWGEKIPDTP